MGNRVYPRVACPRCGVPTTFEPGQAYRPFCSERCKMIDLGQWAAEAYRVPESTPALEEDGPPLQ